MAAVPSWQKLRFCLLMSTPVSTVVASVKVSQVDDKGVLSGYW